MAISKNHINKILSSDFDDWLASLGFLYPITDIQLDRFDKCYNEYEYNLDDAKIDVKSIINGSYVRKAKVVSFFSEDIEKENADFEELRMVARKGQSRIPQHIIDKMRKNHNNKPKDE